MKVARKIIFWTRFSPPVLHTDSGEGLLHLNISGVHFLTLSPSGKVSWDYSDGGVFHGVERKV